MGRSKFGGQLGEGGLSASSFLLKGNGEKFYFKMSHMGTDVPGQTGKCINN